VKHLILFLVVVSAALAQPAADVAKGISDEGGYVVVRDDAMKALDAMAKKLGVKPEVLLSRLLVVEKAKVEKDTLRRDLAKLREVTHTGPRIAPAIPAAMAARRAAFVARRNAILQEMDKRMEWVPVQPMAVPKSEVTTAEGGGS
jgi:hypothetical protein